jgi:A/G-specific adenine glycosylase
VQRHVVLGHKGAAVALKRAATYNRCSRMPIPSDISPGQRSRLRKALLRWYDANRRPLPWRETSDPYRIWVSEIMLQQTRVSAVLEHYRRFLERFPTVVVLASATLPQVLAVWSGLGYYRRARAMHAAAQVVVSSHQGKMPDTLEGLLALPGIGRYTSAAIGSIAFGIPAAVVDGNVERVLQRLLGARLTAAENWTAAESLLDLRRPGDWNQAMMELGATVCLPANPLCSACPVKTWCNSPGADTRRPDPPRLKKTVVLGLATRKNTVYLVQRSARESLMPGMWELPEAASKAGGEIARLKHSITVTDFDIRVVKLAPNGDRRGRWIEIEKLAELPLTGLSRKILRRANLLQSHPNPIL